MIDAEASVLTQMAFVPVRQDGEARNIGFIHAVRYARSLLGKIWLRNSDVHAVIVK